MQLFIRSNLNNRFGLKPGWPLALLIATYLAGMIGLSIPLTEPYFRALTPFSLLLSTAIVFSYHRPFSLQFLFFCLIVYLFGFFIEVAGVHSGLIFGTYYYGETLGPKLWEVPLLIGINWLLLIYSCGCMVAPLRIPLWIKAGLAASLMVLLDIFIEPVAIAFDFWHWELELVPLQNYLGWWIIAFLLELLFFYLPINRNNPTTYFLYILQLIFFLFLFLFII